MVTIRLHDTKARTKRDFVPLDPSNVRMYVCGPTVYDRAHLGNARPVVVFDVLNRLLRHVYGDAHVTYVRNFTDVDDKINAEALRRRQGGAPGTLEDLIRQRTEETIAWYHADMDALGALRPDEEPRATDWIGAMISMIGELEAKGHAYEREGHVLFRVRSYANYGALSGRSVDDMIAGARVEVAPFKEDPMDFVLWKPSSGEEPGWESPWGRGRPGWHIECSAMAQALLGASFDIHGGGIDLQFPHHENEIAQSACAHPEGGFANYWLHNEMLLVEGRKMSKSLGNFFTVRDLLDKGVPGEVIRTAFLLTHYRKPMDLTEARVREVEARLDALFSAIDTMIRNRGVPTGDFERLPTGMQIALREDLDTNAAFTMLESSGERLRKLESGEIVSTSESREASLEREARSFATGLDVLGLHGLLMDRRLRQDGALHRLETLSRRLWSIWAVAKQTKDFSAVDAMKGALAEAGVDVRMSKDSVELVPTTNFDPAKLDALS